MAFDLVTFIDDHMWIIGSLAAAIFIYITYVIFKMTVNKLELNDNFPKEKLQFLAKLDKKEKKPSQKALKKKGKNKKNLLATDDAENGDDSGSTTTTTVSESVDLNKETEQKLSPPIKPKQKNEKKAAPEVGKKSSSPLEQKPILQDAFQPKSNPEIQKLNKENADLKARLQAATEHVKQIEVLKAQLAEARQPKPNEELEKLRKESFDLKARLQASTEHGKQVETLKSQLDELKSAPPPQPIVDPAMKQRISELEEQNSNAEKKMMEVNELVQTLQNENKHLHDREQQISAELDALNREIDQLQNIRLEKENIAQQALDNTEELNKMKQEIDDLEKKNEMCNGSITKLNIELKKAYGETVEHKKERDEMKKTVETLIVEKEELNKLVDINEKKVADFTDYYNETSPRIRELQNTMNSMELEKNDLKMQLSEERARVEELEQSLAKQPSTEVDSSKVKDLEAEVEKLTQKKNELYELTMSLGEKVRTAENQAEQVLKDYEKVSGESYGKAAEVIANSLKSLNIKVSEGIPKTHEEFNKWAQGLPTVLQKVTVEKEFEVKDTVEKEAVRKSSTSRDNGEVKKLKEDVKRYENSIDLLVNQLHAIEAAYAEREAELKAEINALEQTQRN